MASEAQSYMLGLLSTELAFLAVDLSEVAGSREYCFPLKAAQAVLEKLLAKGVNLLGGDLWDLEEGEYFPAGDNWYVDSIEGESLIHRAARVSSTAGRFFERYMNDEKKRVTFVVKIN